MSVRGKLDAGSWCARMLVRGKIECRFEVKTGAGSRCARMPV
jgi:hypothetical protein